MPMEIVTRALRSSERCRDGSCQRPARRSEPNIRSVASDAKPREDD